MINTGLYQNVLYTLPTQMIPKVKKDFEWKKDCLNSLEQIARAQYTRNVYLVENYEMIKGRFIFQHYFGEEGYQDMVQQLTKEFELPNYLRHYDIISPVINTLSGEQQKRPDVFRAKDFSERGSNEFERTKKELLTNFLTQTISAEINQKLLELGIDPQKQDFQSDEEAQAYQQFVDKTQKALTPPEIEMYMRTDFKTAGELWAQHQLEFDKQRFRLNEKEKKEFEDMLVSDRCFRHFYLTAQGYDQETWNPINTFFHKSPEIDYVEDGEYVGRIYYLTISDIIDRFGHFMTEKQLKSLEEVNQKHDQRWAEARGTEYVYENYMMPFKGYPAYDIARQTQGFQNITEQGIPFLDNTFFNNLYSGSLFNTRNGFYLTTEAYWVSQKKIGLVTAIDEQTGVIKKTLVDEDFVVPDHFTEINDGYFDQEQDVNTVVWSWINEVWSGIKINISNSTKLGEDLYLNVKPLEFQFKGNLNPYGAKLPVCGQIFSVRNSRSMSLVDMMKPYQIGFNVAMNQLYQLMEKEIGAFIVMDVNMFPNSKDWGGENAWDKWMLIAKNLGILPADTSPTNLKGSVAAAGGTIPKVLNLDLAVQMSSRVSLADTFKKLAEAQVGFNEYRLGNFASTATATGVQQGSSQSYAQTESYFTNFSNYTRRCYTMNLDIAQYVQSKKKDVTISYVKSDLSTAYIKVMGEDLMSRDIGVFVSNSQENIRQLDMMRQFAISNNTSGLTGVDILDIITMNSPAEIKRQLKEGLNKQEQMQERQQQLSEQQLEVQKQISELKEQKEDERLDKKLQVEIEKAQIVAHTAVSGQQVGEPEDVIGQKKVDLQQQDINSRTQDKQKKHELELNKLIADKEYKNKSIELQKQKIAADLKIQSEKLQQAKVMKGRDQKKKQ